MQKSALRKIKMLYEAREKFTSLFSYYSTIVSEAKHASF